MPKPKTRQVKEQTVAYRRSIRAPSRYKGLSSYQARAVDRVRARLHKLLPNGEIKSLILYGSKARGDARRGSDIDLFLVYNTLTPEQKDTLENLTAAWFSKRPLIHVFTYPATELASERGPNTLHTYNVARDGITLEGEPMAKIEINRRQVAEGMLKLAKDDFATAEMVLAADKIRKAISISYYAMFYAATAALAAKGWVAHSHSGAETLFTRDFINPKLVPNQFKGLLGKGHQARIAADYKLEAVFTKQDAEDWVARAKELIEFVEAALPRWLEE